MWPAQNKEGHSLGEPAFMTLPPPPEVPGFLPDHEGEALYHLGLLVGHLGPLLEIGSWWVFLNQVIMFMRLSVIF